MSDEVEITAEKVIAIGGARWTKNGYDRVYLDDWARFIGLEVGRYNTGNISWAELNGEKISNAEAGRLLGAVQKVYFNVEDGRFWFKPGFTDPRTMTLDEIKEKVVSGIRAEIAALKDEENNNG